MSLTSGAFKIHSILQNLVPQPWHLIPYQQLASISPLYIQLNFKRFRIISRFTTFCWFFPYVICRLCWLFFHWKSYTSTHVDEAVVYGGFFCLLVIFLGVLYLQIKYQSEIIYIVNQIHLLDVLCRERFSSKSCEITCKSLFCGQCVQELIIYGISTGNMLLIICFSAFPLAVTYCPLQILFDWNYFVQITEIFYFSSIGIFNAFGLLSVVLIGIIILDTLIFCTSKMFFPDYPENLKLSKYVRQLRCVQIILTISNNIFGNFNTILILLGVLMTSCMGSMAIRWYGKTDTLIYIMMPTGTIIGFTYALLLSFLASIPYENSKQFLKFWRVYLRSRMDRRIIRACKPIGVNVELYGLGRAQLGLLICDNMIRNMITIVLLDAL